MSIFLFGFMFYFIYAPKEVRFPTCPYLEHQSPNHADPSSHYAIQQC
jgi:hypothetical protein